MGCTLQIKDLCMQVHLGWGDEERAGLQEVRLTLELCFDELAACHTDRLEDTFCYASLSQKIFQVARSSPHRTVERLTSVCFEVVQRELGDRCGIQITLHKVRPPMEGLLGGVFFQMRNRAWQNKACPTC